MGKGSKQSQFYKRLSRLRWLVPAFAFLLVLVHQILEHTLLVYLSRWQHFATQLLFYGLLGPLLAWWVLTDTRRRVHETDQAMDALQQAHERLSATSQRLEFLIGVNHRLSEVEDEDELVALILDLPKDIVPSRGCSVIRFDEQGRPMAATHQGDLAPDEFEAWAHHLSSPEIDLACASCSSMGATDSDDCPLLASTQNSLRVEKVHCVNLVRGNRQYGILTIYLTDAKHPTPREEMLLDALGHELSLALESIELRSRELTMLNRLQHARKSEDLHTQLSQILSETHAMIQVDGAAIFLKEENNDALTLVALHGDLSDTQQQLLETMNQGVCRTNTLLNISDLDQRNQLDSGLRSLIIVPISLEDKALGSVALWASKKNAFGKRHLQMISTVAGQTALLVDNYRLYLQASHQATLTERARLSREIHDGLAQTLGYLTLRTDQVVKWLRAGDAERAASNLEEISLMIEGAYTDAREAIDGLRVKAASESVDDWLEQILTEFQQLCLIQVESNKLPGVQFPSEVQTQLQRIVQEALSNIRKYSGAAHARVEWQKNDYWITLSIVDDGKGFEPEDVPPIAKHGLRIMRERTELLDGDFQIESKPGDGTKVIVRLPNQHHRLRV